jgi:hypothetical protein
MRMINTDARLAKKSGAGPGSAAAGSKLMAMSCTCTRAEPELLCDFG